MSRDVDVFEALGLPADWLNAWLAAIGVTVLLPGVKLSWTDDPIPTARFWLIDPHEIAQLIFGSLPKPSTLHEMGIAEDGPGGKWGQKVASHDLYSTRCSIARTLHDWTISSSVTDLGYEYGGQNPARGQFCVGMEGSETLWKRLVKCIGAIGSFRTGEQEIEATLLGDYGGVNRFAANGLGFDARRLSPSPEGEGWPVVDPVVETLAFFALRIFPVRGSGLRNARPIQKPWTLNGRKSSLVYCTWREPLDVWAIDALLDQPEVCGVETRSFQVVRYIPRSQEKKVAYFSEPVP